MPTSNVPVTIARFANYSSYFTCLFVTGRLDFKSHLN